MDKNAKIAVAVVVGGGAALAIALLYLGHTPVAPPPPPESPAQIAAREREAAQQAQARAAAATPIEVPAPKLIDDYIDNPVRADGTYNGKLVRTQATVRNITPTEALLQSGSRNTSSYVGDIDCPLSQATLGTLNKGDELTIVGRFTFRKNDSDPHAGSLMFSPCAVVP